jgi:hypothetical protein
MHIMHISCIANTWSQFTEMFRRCCSCPTLMPPAPCTFLLFSKLARALIGPTGHMLDFCQVVEVLAGWMRIHNCVCLQINPNGVFLCPLVEEVCMYLRSFGNTCSCSFQHLCTCPSCVCTAAADHPAKRCYKTFVLELGCWRLELCSHALFAVFVCFAIGNAARRVA